MVFKGLVSRLVQVCLRLIGYSLSQMHLVVVDLLDLLLNEIVLLITQKQLCQFLVTYLILSW